MADSRKVEIGSRTMAYNGFFKVEKVELRYERFDGTMSPNLTRESFERGDAAAVLLYNLDTERLILVQQFKYPAHRNGDGWIVETVAGMVDDGEEPAAAARREVLEETGYDLLRLEPIAHFYVSPGGSSERIFLFYGEVNEVSHVARPGGLEGEGEDIRLVEYSRAEFADAVATGQIMDAKTLIAAQWWRAR